MESMDSEDCAMEDFNTPPPSPFLELPGEIRNSIYEYYTANITSLGINRDGSASPPPLMQVNRQVREEMYKLVSHELAPTAVSFEAVAADYNFDHILRFLERFKADPAGRPRDLTISVKFTRYCVDQHELDNIERWIDAHTRFWGYHERHPHENDDEFAARHSEGFHCNGLIGHVGGLYEMHGQAYRLRYKNTTDAQKARMLSECGCLARLTCLHIDRASERWPEKTKIYIELHLSMDIGQDQYTRRIAVNHAGFHGVSNDRRPCAKTEGKRGSRLLKECFAPTTRPRPRSAALLRWQSKKRREGADVTLAKLARTLSLRDGGELRGYEESYRSESL
ncbi:hypothetical protein LTR08_004657 [Meristemomyces frigidus]|nr:hypothetical protein LTR08_004657 [Meristemomyces frigidus]